MGRTTRIDFPVHIFRRCGHYKCSCGHRFTRVKTGEWTENPFHQWVGREDELNAKCRADADRRLQKVACPHCDKVVSPTRITG
jgi:TPP-dependent 2-oxoacid decarboxylase